MVQILITQRVYAEVEGLVAAERLPDLALRGVSRPVVAYDVFTLKNSGTAQ